MASAVVQELQRLGQGWSRPAGSNIKSRASLLFQPQQAADVDAQTIYTICLAGGPWSLVRFLQGLELFEQTPV